MKLIGSTTSPFVRKVRLLLEDDSYDFETLTALSQEGMKILETYGPVKRIPILMDDGKLIFDSAIICEYLLNKKNISLSIEEKLTMKLIDELCDSCIALFQYKLWEIDVNWSNELSSRMLSRTFGILDLLEQMQANDKLSILQKDWLYCVLDWLSFRHVLDWKSGRENLITLYETLQQMDKFQSTKLA